MSLRPAGVDHHEGDEEATQTIKECKGVVVAVDWTCGGMHEMREKKRMMSGGEGVSIRGDEEEEDRGAFFQRCLYSCLAAPEAQPTLP